MLTIKTFSRITAIPETTLRFYEDQGVLAPAARSPAGYRLYAPDQILPAKFLYSLRLASIPMDEVKAYQEAPGDSRHATLTQWHADLGRRIAWMQLAQKYVETLMSGEQEPVHLQMTEAERVLWFVHDGPVGNFRDWYALRGRQLADLGCAPTDSYFRFVSDLEPGRVRGEVGYRVDRLPARLPDGAVVEERPASLTLSLEHKGPMPEVPRSYERLFAFMAAHGWEAAGPAIERYPGGPGPCYTEILVPILTLEGSVRHD